MGGLPWFFAGIGIGMAYGALLWRAARALQPGDVSRPDVLAFSWLVLRCLLVALFLTVAVRQSLSFGLWSLAGYLASRTLWVLWIGLSTTNARSRPSG